MIANFTGDRKVFYGIYDAVAERAIVLNTLYLRQQQPAVTVLIDKEVYRPGDTVTASIVTTQTSGLLSVLAPEFTQQLPLVDGSQFSFALPSTTSQGTHAIYYTLTGSSTPEDGREHSTYFDVDTADVYVRAADIPAGSYHPDDPVAISLTLTSDTELDATLRTWIRYPDGTEGQASSQVVHLLPIPNNYFSGGATIEKSLAGTHLLLYEMTALGQPLNVAGEEAFDVGSGSLMGVGTDAGAYDSVDEITVRLQVLATQPITAELTFALDSGYLYKEDLSLPAGLIPLTRTLAAGTSAPGIHVLTATLNLDGLTSVAFTSFDYGVDLPDLVVAPPWLEPGDDLAASQLDALVANQGSGSAGASSASFYLGNGASGILLGTVDVPPLAAGEITVLRFPWDAHEYNDETLLMRAVVDSSGSVTEYNEDNNWGEGLVTPNEPPRHRLFLPLIIRDE